MYKKTQDFLSAEDMDALNISPAWFDKGVSTQAFAIAPLNNRDVSMVMSKVYSDDRRTVAFCQMIFTESEVDMIIEALQECKKRWDTGRVIGG